MCKKRIERVFFDPKTDLLMIASCDEYNFNPQTVGDGGSRLLRDQINTMIFEAEQRGIKQGAEKCLKKCLSAIRDMGQDL